MTEPIALLSTTATLPLFDTTAKLALFDATALLVLFETTAALVLLDTTATFALFDTTTAFTLPNMAAALPLLDLPENCLTRTPRAMSILLARGHCYPQFGCTFSDQPDLPGQQSTRGSAGCPHSGNARRQCFGTQ